MKYKKIEVSLLSALIITALLSFTGFATTCAEIRDSVLRLHVIANSDSEGDQALKLLVRDAVLNEGADIFDGTLTSFDAEEKLAPYTGQLKKAAADVIKTQGYDYDVQIKVGEEYFDTRTYENVTLPAGKYRSVKVVIGEGIGENWWCVMFPPMCLPAAEAQTNIDAFLDDGQVRLVESDPEYEIRFKFVEVYEQITEKLRKYF